MKNIRSKINQLRVAYFTPTKPVVSSDSSTSDSYTTSSACYDKPLKAFGSCLFYTPTVDYCGFIPSVVREDNRVQTSSVQQSSSFYRPLLTQYCIPFSLDILNPSNTTRTGRFYLLDFTQYVRLGYRNVFHQYGKQYLDYPLNFDCPLNLYF